MPASNRATHKPQGEAQAVAGTTKPSTIGKLLDACLKGVLLYFIVQIGFNLWNVFAPAHLKGNTSQESHEKDPNTITSAWSFGEKSNLYVYLSPEPIQMVFDDADLKLFKPDIVFGSFDSSMSAKVFLNVTLPSNRASPYEALYAHVYLSRNGYHPDPTKSKYDDKSVVYRRINLVGRMKKPAELIKLLSNEKKPNEAAQKEKNAEEETVPYWYPEVHVSLVQSEDPVNVSLLPFNLRKHYSLTMKQDHYLPIVYLNEFWQLKDKRIILDKSQSTVPLTISFAPMGLVKFQLLTNFDMALKRNEDLLGSDGETEKLKQMFFETNPYLLGVTLLVSLLHSFFDILAFKNDIQFWRKKDNLEGLSVRSVLVNALFQVIISLYLFDQETSWLILASVTAGTLIELWKITKVLTFRVYWSNGFPRLQIQDRASYANSLTQEYDRKAMWYLAVLGAPLLIGYSTYALITQPQKGWYSWTLGTLVGFVYSFGFIMMTPQLFINYKLKSVAHMPWRVFIYKALNTFIDDLFAFIIKMPTLHRLACFRDDIIFLVYLYQRWVYPVDKSRPNEYGQVFENKGDDEASGISKDVSNSEAFSPMMKHARSPSSSTRSRPKRTQKSD